MPLPPAPLAPPADAPPAAAAPPAEELLVVSTLPPPAPPELARLEQHAADGLCEIGPYQLEVTPLGRMFVRNLAMVFDAYLEPGKGAFSRTV